MTPELTWAAARHGWLTALAASSQARLAGWLALVGEARNTVSDIRMPGGSGLQLLEKVREMQPGLPVIIMTAYSDL
ncbi:MAG: hypothetical protein B7X34_07765, partial [Acidobacteriia bacterium 12-62-4]